MNQEVTSRKLHYVILRNILALRLRKPLLTMSFSGRSFRVLKPRMVIMGQLKFPDVNLVELFLKTEGGKNLEKGKLVDEEAFGQLLSHLMGKKSNAGKENKDNFLSQLLSHEFQAHERKSVPFFASISELLQGDEGKLLNKRDLFRLLFSTGDRPTKEGFLESTKKAHENTQEELKSIKEGNTLAWLSVKQVIQELEENSEESFTPEAIKDTLKKLIVESEQKESESREDEAVRVFVEFPKEYAVERESQTRIGTKKTRNNNEDKSKDQSEITIEKGNIQKSNESPKSDKDKIQDSQAEVLFSTNSGKRLVESIREQDRNPEILKNSGLNQETTRGPIREKSQTDKQQLFDLKNGEAKFEVNNLTFIKMASKVSHLESEKESVKEGRIVSENKPEKQDKAEAKEAVHHWSQVKSKGEVKEEVLVETPIANKEKKTMETMRIFSQKADLTLAITQEKTNYQNDRSGLKEPNSIFHFSSSKILDLPTEKKSVDNKAENPKSNSNISTEQPNSARQKQRVLMEAIRSEENTSKETQDKQNKVKPSDQAKQEKEQNQLHLLRNEWKAVKDLPSKKTEVVEAKELYEAVKSSSKDKTSSNHKGSQQVEKNTEAQSKETAQNKSEKSSEKSTPKNANVDEKIKTTLQRPVSENFSENKASSGSNRAVVSESNPPPSSQATQSASTSSSTASTSQAQAAAQPETGQTSMGKVYAEQIAKLQESTSQQIVRSVQGSMGSERSHINLQLQPEHLGKVHIQLKIESGQLSAEITAMKSNTRELLQQSVQHLRSAFDDQGIKVDKIVIRETHENRSQDQDSRDRSSQSRNEQGGGQGNNANHRQKRNLFMEWWEQYTTGKWSF